MISIRKYLQTDREADRETENVLLQLARLLIEGIECHAVGGAPGELEHLRASTQQILAALVSDSPPLQPGELLGFGMCVVDALKQHNENVVEYLRAPIAELQAKVKLLTAAITDVSSTSAENIARLRQIKARLLPTIGVKDIHLLKMHLSECLDGVLVEAERQRAESGRAAERLHRAASQPLNSPGTVEQLSTVDPATGFLIRDRAEEVIAQACQDDAPAFVVVMALNQVQTLNRNFGAQLGEVILQRFAAFIRVQLPPIDQLFRWTGPTIVSLVRRRSAQEVRAAIQPLLARKLGYAMNTGTGDVHVPISSRWIVLPLMASPRLLFHKIDGFASSE